jgi:hypothetical protein
MAYIYVKSGGTATGTAGKYDTQKTGSWSTAFTATSQYYSSLRVMGQNITPTLNDLIFVSDLHNATTSISGSTTIGNNEAKIYCVDDDNIEILSTGGKEYFSGSAYVTSIQCSYMYGITIERSVPHLSISSAYYPHTTTFENCDFLIRDDNLSDGVYLNGSSIVYYKNCYFQIGPTGTYAEYIIPNSGVNIFLNCEFTGATRTQPIFYRPINLTGGSRCFVRLICCDFSSLDRPLFSNDTNNESMITSITLDRCKIGATNGRLTNPLGHYDYPNAFYNSGSSAKDYFSQYFKYGNIEASTSVYRDNGNILYGTSVYSLKVTSSARSAGDYKLLRFKLMDFIADTTSSTTFTVEIAQDNAATALTTADVFMELFYPDNSSAKDFYQSTEIPVLASSSNLSTSSVNWTGLTNPTKQYLSITTTNTGKEGLCSVWINVLKGSVTFYVCAKVDVT